MLQNYVLFTDSTSDLTKEIIEEFGIKIVPLRYTIDGKVSEDFVGCDEPCKRSSIKDFYNQLKNGKTAVTSQINPIDCRNVVVPYLEKGLDVLFIAFSSSLSGTYNSIKLAFEELSSEYPERKLIAIDSLCASLGEGLLVFNAAIRKKNGNSIEEVAEWVEKNKLKHCHIFMVDDLQHLKRGGRVSKSQSFFGSLLNIKPVMFVNDDGKLCPFSKARSKKNAFKLMVSKMQEDIENPFEQTIFISHSDAEEDANTLANMVKKELNVKNVVINFIGSVIGSHTGQGTVAIFYMGRKRKLNL